MMKRTILILSLLLGHLWQSHGQVMMMFSSDSLVNITSPLDVDSLFYWFAADQGVTDSLGGAIATDEGVGTWNDLSGNGYHVTQGTNGARPVYKATGGPGSKPCIQFDGTNDFLASAAHWWGSDDLTVFLVMKFGNATRDASEFPICRLTTTSTRQWDIFGQAASASYAFWFRAYNDGASGNSRQAISAANFKHTALKAHSLTHNGSTTTTLFSDASSVSLTSSNNGTGNGAVYNYTGKTSVGAIFPDGTPAGFLQGSISEIIVYSRALTTAERQAIETYLNKKYDLY